MRTQAREHVVGAQSIEVRVERLQVFGFGVVRDGDEQSLFATSTAPVVDELVPGDADEPRRSRRRRRPNASRPRPRPGTSPTSDPRPSRRRHSDRRDSRRPGAGRGRRGRAASGPPPTRTMPLSSSAEAGLRRPRRTILPADSVGVPPRREVPRPALAHRVPRTAAPSWSAGTRLPMGTKPPGGIE